VEECSDISEPIESYDLPVHPGDFDGAVADFRALWGL